MLVIRTVDAAKTIPALWGLPDLPILWDDYCREKGLVALAAEQGPSLVGFAIAESHPQLIRILNLEGDRETCRRLLNRLIRLAGERDLAGWFPRKRKDLQRLVKQLGFVRSAQDVFQGRPCSFCYWDRNRDVWSS
jgi:hypothetical protein